MKSKNNFLAWEFFFQLGWFGLPMMILNFVDMKLYAHVAVALAVYLNKVFAAAEISFLDYRISELEKSENPELLNS